MLKGITLTTGTYASPLTIAPAGTIAPTGTRADAISFSSGGGETIDEAGQLNTGRRRWPPASEAETPRLRTGRSFLAYFFKKANAYF